ncbi:MAG: SBBP repeat-containing protein [Ignavibacteria bacterium]|nr:SBBP repeat-containing protein [Ignavibacteria bacterium]
MKILSTLCLLMLVNAGILSAQSLQVFPPDVTNFPSVEAPLYCFDASGAVLRPTIADISVTELSIPCQILSLVCPPATTLKAISTVLTIDVSGSMNDKIKSTLKIDIAKEAARAWIAAMPPGGSECAVTSFDGANYLHQDFTTDKNLLLAAVNSLSPKEGTDYDAGLLHPQAGALQIAKNAKYEKFIVFLSDGLPSKDPKVDSIVAEAQRQNCKIYCVMVGMVAPQSMREISSRTGGRCFESVSQAHEIQSIYRSILAEAQGIEPCKLIWQSSASCIPSSRNVFVTFTSPTISSQTKYTPPGNSISALKFTPSTLYYSAKPPGAAYDTTISVLAQNATFTVTSITSSNPNFDITPKNFNVLSGQTQVLTVHYTPSDSGYAWTKFELINDICPVNYFVSAGFAGKPPTSVQLKLDAPNGAEEFPVGNDTLITWSGISPADTVTLDYSTNNGASWELIAPKATGGKYAWKVPNTPSNQCLARVRQFNSERESWAMQFKGNNLDESRAITMDGAGNIYVGGSYKGVVTIGTFTLTNTSLTTTDAFVAKIKPDKSVEWVLPIVSSGNDVVTSLAVDIAGNIFATGTFASNAVVGGKSITEINNTALGELFLIKLKNDGMVEWTQNAGSKYADVGGHLATDGAGNVYMVGGFDWDAKFGNVVVSYTEKLRNTMYVAKFRSDGTMDWVKIIEKTGSNSGHGVCTDRNGNLFITGQYEVPAQIGNTIFYEGNIFLVKFTPSGTIDWENNIGGDIYGEGVGVTADDNGKIIVTGSFYEKMLFGSLQFYSNGNEDIFLASYTNAGKLDWATHAGGSGRDKGRSIAVDGSGSIYIVGEFQAEADFDGMTIKNSGGNGGFNDIFLSKYFPDGKIEYAKQAGGLGADFCTSIASDRLGNIAMTGTFEYDATFDTTTLYADTIINFINKDIYIWSSFQRELQSDVSDAVWSIVAPNPGGKDVDMGQVLVQSSRDSLIERLVFNRGNVSFAVHDIQIIGADSAQFMMVSGMPPLDVPANDGVNVEFRFRPTSPGLKQAQVSIITGGDTLFMKIFGIGILPPTRSLNNGIIDFGKVFVGNYRDTVQAAVLKNIGTSALVIDSVVRVTPNIRDFTLQSTIRPISLQPDSILTVDARFTATESGRTSGRLLIYYQGVGSPVAVQLFGEGINNSVLDTLIVSNDSTRGFPGDIVQMPIRIQNGARLAQLSGTLLRVNIRCNATLLFPVDSTPIGILSGSERTFTLTVPVLPSDDTVVAVYPFLAMLGNDTATIVTLENVTIEGGSAPVHVRNGHFQLLGVCFEGGARLLNTTAPVTLSIRPNPITHQSDIEFETIENNRTKLSIIDATGQVVQDIFDGVIAKGKHTIPFTKQTLPTGTYFLIFETPTIRKAVRMEVK